jgi:4-hydroxythreonine-4-phosphate dehydrogenase
VIRLALTIGDPSGIGPEVLVRALAALVSAPSPGGASAASEVLVIGDAATWRDAQRVASVSLPAVAAEQPGPLRPDGVPFLEIRLPDRGWSVGTMSSAAGRAAATWLEHAVRMALEDRADAVVFAPLNKQAIMRAGYAVRDEYELCAQLAGNVDHDEVNVIAHPAGPPDALLWVARATGHVPLREVPALLTVERVLRTIRLAHRMAGSTADGGVSGVGAASPRVGVAALNPHAGEGGLLGDDEIRVIAPAIAAAAREGIGAIGPVPADHLFRRARAGEFDAVVAQYHDQAQIATKLLGFDRGVSVGVGYPFVLTTPSHGTAFDIAGRGAADPRPMQQALDVARRLVSGSGPGR